MPDFSNRTSIDASQLLTAVAALESQFAVRTDTPGAMRVVASLFRNMREPLDAHAHESLALRQTKTAWIVSGGLDAEDLHGPLSDARWELRERITRLFMNTRPDLLWLHAAGVAQDGHAILITGPSGSGKSMLAATLVAEGFDYLGDDVLPVDACTKTVHPFPITPAVRGRSPHYMLTADARRLPKRNVVVKRDQVATAPMPIAAIVFPTFSPGPTLTKPVSPAQVAFELLRQCRNFERHREYAVRAMTAIAETTPASAVSFVDATRGADAIGSLIRGIR
jgi:hypothetical protein